MERRSVKRVAAVAAGLALLAAVVGTRADVRAPRTAERPSPPDVNGAPESRVRVQVLNATSTRGLARRATMLLRDAGGGLDVVDVGTSPDLRESTLVLDRSGHPDRARRVADALGEKDARVESRPDSSRYLDVTVLLGRSWRPPAEPFYP